MQQETTSPGDINNADFVWLLASLCQLHRIPFDEYLAIRQNPPPHTLTQLLKALDDTGQNPQTARFDVRSCKRMVLPFIAFEKAASFEPHPASVTLALVIQSDGEQVAYFSAGTDQPHNVSVDEFLARYEPDVISIERAIPEPAEEAPTSIPDSSVNHSVSSGLCPNC
jgi:subfamily B ATP-binding cassette protein HlyB/CyaB